MDTIYSYSACCFDSVYWKQAVIVLCSAVNLWSSLGIMAQLCAYLSRKGLNVVISQFRPDLAVVVVTGYGSIATALEAVRRGARSYLTKPVGISQMLAALAGSTAEDQSPPRVPSLARVEWEHIHAVLRSCEGNITQAAKLLGIHRRSLQRKLKDPPSEGE